MSETPKIMQGWERKESVPLGGELVTIGSLELEGLAISASEGISGRVEVKTTSEGLHENIRK